MLGDVCTGKGNCARPNPPGRPDLLTLLRKGAAAELYGRLAPQWPDLQIVVGAVVRHRPSVGAVSVDGVDVEVT